MADRRGHKRAGSVAGAEISSKRVAAGSGSPSSRTLDRQLAQRLTTSAVRFCELVKEWQNPNGVVDDGSVEEVDHDYARSHHASDADVFALLVQSCPAFLRSLPASCWKPLEPRAKRQAALPLVVNVLAPVGLADLVLDYVVDWTVCGRDSLLVWHQKDPREDTGAHEPPTRVPAALAPAGVALWDSASDGEADAVRCKPVDEVVAVPETGEWERYYCRDFSRKRDGGNTCLRVEAGQAHLLAVPDLRAEFVRFLATCLAARAAGGKSWRAFETALATETARLGALSLSEITVGEHDRLAASRTGDAAR